MGLQRTDRQESPVRAVLKVALATLVMFGSLVVGLLVLTDSVYASTAPQRSDECGAIGMVALGPSHTITIETDADEGLDIPAWERACVSEARQQLWWAAPPLVLGLASVLYLGAGFTRVVRRSKAEGRSQGALVG